MLKNSLYRLIGVAGVMCLSLTMLSGCGEEESVYRETTVEYGVLSVGKTESGSVDIGTVEQTFDLDMNALQRVEISDNSSIGGSRAMIGMGTAGDMMGSAGGNMGGNFGGGAGAMNMFSQIFDMAGGGSVVSGESNTELEIAEVLVTVGEKVEAGDILYLLDEEGVAELSEELESNVKKAKADLEAVIADQNLTKTTAKYTYEISIAYGNYAETERAGTLASLNDAVAEKEEALTDAQENLSLYQSELSQINTEYEKAVQALSNAEWSRDNTDKYNSLYLYTVYAENAISAKSLVDSLEQEKEQLETQVEQAESNVAQCEKSLANAHRSLESGKLSAQETYELRMLAYETAQETYDIAVAYLEDDLKTQEEIYTEASGKWEEFTAHIDGNAVRSKYNGVITGVNLAVGDSLGTGTTVITLYDTEEVSMTVTLDEEDMTDIKIGNIANISFTAYPDEIYLAEVTEISDASTDSDGNTTYDVTATISENGEKLFQGMTGEITFVTKESEEVMYVSNRAIIREGKESYAKVKDESGTIRKTKVVTGFSDGVNVEIIEGLNVGDVVLIESKVSAE